MAEGGAPLEAGSEELQSGDSRYALFAAWLQGQIGDAVEVPFTEVERIIRGKLPASARAHRAWWANDSVSHTHSKLWLDVGWRTAGVDIDEHTVTFVRTRDRKDRYIAFFSTLLARLRDITPPFPVRNPRPDGSSWLVVADLPGRPIVARFVYSFALRGRFRVELYIDSGDALVNKDLFDALRTRASEVERAIGAAVSWERLDDRRASRIAVYHAGSITDAPQALEQLQGWAVDTMLRFQPALVRAASQEAL